MQRFLFLRPERGSIERHQCYEMSWLSSTNKETRLPEFYPEKGFFTFSLIPFSYLVHSYQKFCK